MAKQAGHIFITGTIDDVTYYKMFGTYYARMKSTLSRKKVLTSPRFERTRIHANQLAEASRIASELYRSIPKEKRNRQLFRSIVGEAKVLLATGKNKEAVSEILSNALNPQMTSSKPKQKIKVKSQERAYVSKAGRLIWKSFNDNLKNINSNKQLLIDNYSNITLTENNLPSVKLINERIKEYLE